MKEIKTIALTGGPCSGKSSAIATVKERLESLGFSVIIVPEAPTDLILRGITPRTFPENNKEGFQQLVGDKILFDLRQAHLFAQGLLQCDPPQKPVILCDRGIPDIAAYTDTETYRSLIEKWSKGTPDAIKEDLYDYVIHMVTAADGAEEYYTLTNNYARSEDPAHARLLDQATSSAWLGHSHMHVVDNSTDFQGKLGRVLAHVCHFLGIPEPLELERKYLVKEILRPLHPLGSPGMVVHEIRQAYRHCAEGEEERIRSRTMKSTGFVSYFHTEKRTIGQGKRVERERVVSFEEFSQIELAYELRGRFLVKDRYSFIENGRHFELDIIRGPLGTSDTVILECEVSSLDEEPKIPDWLVIEKEVTGDRAFSNYRIWARQFPY